MQRTESAPRAMISKITSTSCQSIGDTSVCGRRCGLAARAFLLALVCVHAGAHCRSHSAALLARAFADTREDFFRASEDVLGLLLCVRNELIGAILALVDNVDRLGTGHPHVPRGVLGKIPCLAFNVRAQFFSALGGIEQCRDRPYYPTGDESDEQTLRQTISLFSHWKFPHEIVVKNKVAIAGFKIK